MFGRSGKRQLEHAVGRNGVHAFQSIRHALHLRADPNIMAARKAVRKPKGARFTDRSGCVGKVSVELVFSVDANLLLSSLLHLIRRKLPF